MKKIRQISNNPIVIVLILINFIFVSCNNDDLMISETKVKYSGEELMKGLFFFQNDISSNVNFLRDYKQQIYSLGEKEEVNAELKNLSEVATNYINTYKPEFFKELQRAMYSGNFYLIEAKLDECVLLINNSMAMSEKYSKAFEYAEKLKNSPKFMEFIQTVDLTSAEGQQKLNDFLSRNPEYEFDENGQGIAAPIFVGPAVIAYAFVGAVSIAVAAYSVVTKAAYWDPTKKLKDSDLDKEVIIKEISEYLTNIK